MSFTPLILALLGLAANGYGLLRYLRTAQHALAARWLGVTVALWTATALAYLAKGEWWYAALYCVLATMNAFSARSQRRLARAS